MKENNVKKNHHQKPHKNKVTQFTVEEPDELLSFLINKLNHRSRNAVKSILSRGQVTVDHEVKTKYNVPLKIGQVVSIGWTRSVETNEMEGITISYEDEAIIVIEKSAGILSMSAGREGEMTAYRQLTEYVRASHPNQRIFIVHRLDRDTSGVMIFAKTQRVKEILQKTWKESVKERVYIALVQGHVSPSKGTITSWLKESKTLLMYSSPRPNGGKKAVTHYEVINKLNGFSLLSLRLETGRKNQIRVHMKDIGHPIVGDKKYGSTSKVIGRLGLHAHIIAFVHPITGKLLRFESKIPTVFNKPLKQS